MKVVTIVLMFISATTGYCQDLVGKTGSLKGAAGFHVVVDNDQFINSRVLSSGATKLLITRQFKTGGVPVLTLESPESLEGGIVTVTISSMKDPNNEGIWFYVVQCMVGQIARLDRDERMLVASVTWNDARMGVEPFTHLQGGIKKQLSLILSGLIKDFLEANE